MATPWMLISGVFGAISNFCIRRNIDENGSSKIFFSLYLLITGLVTIILHPIRANHYECNYAIICVGCLAGICLSMMKLTIAGALKRGPSGLTFAVINSASVLPTVMLILILGQVAEYRLSFLDGLGAFFVIAGLCWAGTGTSNYENKRTWLFFALSAFFLHLLFLSIIEYRAMMVQEKLSSDYNLSSEWFAPTIFISAALFHAFGVLLSERRTPEKQEIFWGSLGGVFNGICAFLFTLATEAASNKESIVIFSIFSISLIISCAIWGQVLYKEGINWKAHLLCSLGIIMTGSVN